MNLYNEGDETCNLENNISNAQVQNEIEECAKNEDSINNLKVDDSKDEAPKDVIDDKYSWYVARATAMHEKSAIEWLKQLAKDRGCLSDIEEYFIPQIKCDKKDENGEKIGEIDKSYMSGYFAVKMYLSAEIKRILNSIGTSPNSKYKIVIFTSQKMTASDLKKMKQSLTFAAENIESEFNIGDEVRITHDNFPNMCGIITNIDNASSRIYVNLDIFGRIIPLDLPINKVKKIKSN